MPLTTTTSVVNADPASVIVTVREETGGGGAVATVDVYVTTDAAFASPDGQPHDPEGWTLSNPPTTVCWTDQEIAARGEKRFTVVLAPGTAVDGPVCGVVTCIVQGIYGGAEYFEVRTPVVCFP